MNVCAVVWERGGGRGGKRRCGRKGRRWGEELMGEEKMGLEKRGEGRSSKERKTRKERWETGRVKRSFGLCCVRWKP